MIRRRDDFARENKRDRANDYPGTAEAPENKSPSLHYVMIDVPVAILIFYRRSSNGKEDFIF